MKKQAAVPFRFRQGDILVTAVSSIPADARTHTRPLDARGRVVLAHGEVTGHAHAIDGRLATAYGPSDDAFWIEVQPGASVTHDEHTAALIPPDVQYLKVTRQREYSEAGERRVQD